MPAAVQKKKVLSLWGWVLDTLGTGQGAGAGGVCYQKKWHLINNSQNELKKHFYHHFFFTLNHKKQAKIMQ